MQIYSYVVLRDYGFAPNPFFNICTLATCKPKIRKSANIGDIILGTGSAKYKQTGKAVFAMKVDEILDFNAYWSDPRLNCKQPKFTSLKRAYGDNIYHKNNTTDGWLQEDSHHSHPDGSPNDGNIARDTQVDRILLSRNYIYWGGKEEEIPNQFRNWQGPEKKFDICTTRPTKCHFPADMVEAFDKWFTEKEERGFINEPRLFMDKSIVG